MANLNQSLEYTMEDQMAMESALWEHRILIEFHQNAHNLLKNPPKNPTLSKPSLEEAENSFSKLKFFRQMVEIYGKKADDAFDRVGELLVNVTELSLICLREDHLKNEALEKLQTCDNKLATVQSANDSGFETNSHSSKSPVSIESDLINFEDDLIEVEDNLTLKVDNSDLLDLTMINENDLPEPIAPERQNA